MRARVFDSAGSFAGDKDAAAEIRESYLKPRLAAGEAAQLDFSDVDFATQSFVHALLSAVVRDDPASLDRIEFLSCNDDVQSLIEIVVEYSQEEFQTDSPERDSGTRPA
jgi:hypothetical protein